MSHYAGHGAAAQLPCEPLRSPMKLPSLPDTERQSLPTRRFSSTFNLAVEAEPGRKRRPDVNTDKWLARLARIVTPLDGGETEEARTARIDEAAYVVLDTLDDLLFADKLARCGEILERADADGLPVEILLTLLAGTLRVREALGAAREGLLVRVEERLRREAPDRVELLLRGLR